MIRSDKAIIHEVCSRVGIGELLQISKVGEIEKRKNITLFVVCTSIRSAHSFKISVSSLA